MPQLPEMRFSVIIWHQIKMTTGEKNRKQQSTWLINVLIAVSKGGFICGSYDYVMIMVGTKSFSKIEWFGD